MRRQKLKRGVYDALVTLLCCIIGVPLMLEVLLRLTDPLGWYAAAASPTSAEIMCSDPRGYSVCVGTHINEAGITVTALDDRTRLVPDTDTSVKTTLYIVGDSVTFGTGVSDGDTYSNLIAQHCPTLHVKNLGVIGYNIDRLTKSFEQYPDADVYLWLAIPNDVESDGVYPFPRAYLSTATEVYITRFVRNLKPQDATIDDAVWDAYIPKVEAILDKYQPIFVVQDDKFGQRLKESVPAVNVIEHYLHVLSAADSHPNITGHQELAREILPLLSEYGCSEMAEE